MGETGKAENRKHETQEIMDTDKNYLLNIEGILENLDNLAESHKKSAEKFQKFIDKPVRYIGVVKDNDRGVGTKGNFGLIFEENKEDKLWYCTNSEGIRGFNKLEILSDVAKGYLIVD